MVWNGWERIRHVLCDVDGVLTSGSLVYDADGEQRKVFHARDGHMIRVALRCGIGVGLVSGRRCAALQFRADDLGLAPCLIGVQDKQAEVAGFLAGTDLDWASLAFIGDDLPDLPVMAQVGCPVAVADAHPRVRQRALWVSPLPGGQGAVAAFLEALLRRTGRWRAEEWGTIHG